MLVGNATMLGTSVTPGEVKLKPHSGFWPMPDRHAEGGLVCVALNPPWNNQDISFAGGHWRRA